MPPDVAEAQRHRQTRASSRRAAPPVDSLGTEIRVRHRCGQPAAHVRSGGDTRMMPSPRTNRYGITRLLVCGRHNTVCVQSSAVTARCLRTQDLLDVSTCCLNYPSLPPGMMFTNTQTTRKHGTWPRRAVTAERLAAIAPIDPSHRLPLAQGECSGCRRDLRVC